MFRLDDKSAIVTGAGSGIGKAIALLLAGQGAMVFVLDIDETGGLETEAEIIRLGGRALYQHCNVAERLSVDLAVKQVLEHCAAIDILVNNAGVAHVGNAVNTGPEDFERIYSINVKGVYHLLQAVIPAMKTKGGAIVNMCSIAASMGLENRFAYSMSKGAVLAMTRSTARDFLADGIRCNAVSPARVHTPFVDGFISKNYPGREKEMFDALSRSQPIGRMGTVDEVAHLVLYLCSPEAAFVTGADYPIDGGTLGLL